MKQNISLAPKNFIALVEPTDNIYETTMIVAKRAKQIVVKTKGELDAKFAAFTTHTDNLEEIFENKERIELSKYYENKLKPTILATEDFLADKIRYRYPDEEASPKM